MEGVALFSTSASRLLQQGHPQPGGLLDLGVGGRPAEGGGQRQKQITSELRTM